MVKFVTEPEIYITAAMKPIDEAVDAFFAARGQNGAMIPRGGGVESCVVLGSRSCYESYDRGREHAAHCEHVIASGHTSVLEHAVFQVVLTGISRSCGRELLRHRHLSPSERSQRYCDSSDIRFVIPPLDLFSYDVWRRGTKAFEETHDAKEISARWCEFDDFYNLCYQSLRCYTLRLSRGNTKQHKEAARKALLESAETLIVFTGNVRAYRNLFEKRCSSHADAEIRRCCCRLYEKMLPLAPNLLSDYDRSHLADGTFELLPRSLK